VYIIFMFLVPQKSRSHKRCLQGKFTTNPKQYFQFGNKTKYEQILDQNLDLVINTKTRNFNNTELSTYINKN
jgi:hypothetical protein